MLQSEAKSSQSFTAQLEQIISRTQQSCLTTYEDGFFNIFTAASLNHKEARYFYSMFIENGIIPAPNLVEEMTAEGKKYHFLRFLVDTDTSLPFKFNNRTDSANFKLQEFESDSKAQSLANLYLSAQIGSPYDLYDYKQDLELLGYSEAIQTGFEEPIAQ